MASFTKTIRSLKGPEILLSQHRPFLAKNLILRSTKEYRVNMTFPQNPKQLHTTNINKALPVVGPILIKLAAPLYRMGFFLGGRIFRRWWLKLPKDRQIQYSSFITKNRKFFSVVFVTAVGMSGLYYMIHIEETPMTGRRRFIMVSNEQMQECADLQSQNLNLNLSDLRLPVNHALHMKVYRIAKTILESNITPEVNALKWEINVINNNEVNAFVLANGQMFVYTGMLAAVKNEHELAGVLAHEMAHAILNHSSELVSRSGFFNFFSLIVLGGLSAVVPTSGGALIASWFESTIKDILLTLPYSRKLEREADEVGMQLAARACFDVRYMPKFWERMHKTDAGQTPDWLSTHPSHENRVSWLNDLLPTALNLREGQRCPQLNKFFDTALKSS